MKSTLWISFLFIIFSSCGEELNEKSPADIQIIPRPQEITLFNGTFELTAATSIKADRELVDKAEQLRSYLSPATGFQFPIKKRCITGNTIELRLLDKLSSLGEEGYQLAISNKKVLITAYKPQGILWGIQTLRQLLPVEILREAKVDHIEWGIPNAIIVDKPRFEWRGLMIDYSRTFWNISHTKKYIDALSYFKMNKLHMHLTDNQGWRLEIDQFPALTEKASKFDTMYHEPQEMEGYYSKADLHELVRYAEARNVELVPEIEMPGHSTEVFAAYPELSCTGDTLSIHPYFKGPRKNEIFCAGKTETFRFLENVLSEVIDLFPSQYIHIGGDEANTVMWQACPDCQRVMEENGMKDEAELQSWFIKKIEAYLNSKDKRLIGWDEIIEGGLSETATVMFWRGSEEETPLAVVNQGNNVIMTPTSHCYFDYTYEKIPIKKVYLFEPLSGKFEAANPKQILGVQANFWSHIDRTEPKMDRQIFPRILALAEVGWTEGLNRNWDNFNVRLQHHHKSLTLLDIYYMKD